MADITRLDRTGIPVTLAIRPAATTLSISSGKGMSPEAAYVSGLMEALELFHAENAVLEHKKASFNEMMGKDRTVKEADLPRRKHSLSNRDWPEVWTPTWDIVSNQEIWVPFCTVGMQPDLLNKLSAKFSPYQMDSNGLASGNSFLEAVLSGLLEVIERDAYTLFTERLKQEQVALRRTPSLAEGWSLEVERLIYVLDKRGFNVFIDDCTCDTGIPVFRCILYDELDEQVGASEGFGAHLDPEVALLRAITEAAQGRAVVISGSRDDIFHFHAKLASFSRLLHKPNKVCTEAQQMQKPADTSSATFEEDINYVIDNLAKVGLGQVLVQDLSFLSSDVSVVRVIVPGLEGYKTKTWSPGIRASMIRKARGLHDGLALHEPEPFMQHMPAGGVR